jgi:hypothetical protein
MTIHFVAVEAKKEYNMVALNKYNDRRYLLECNKCGTPLEKNSDIFKHQCKTHRFLRFLCPIFHCASLFDEIDE